MFSQMLQHDGPDDRHTHQLDKHPTGTQLHMIDMRHIYTAEQVVVNVLQDNATRQTCRQTEHWSIVAAFLS